MAWYLQYILSNNKLSHQRNVNLEQTNRSNIKTWNPKHKL